MVDEVGASRLPRNNSAVYSGIKHPCIVDFMGFSINPFAVVMELVPCGNLYKFLHNETQPLSWEYRMKVAINVAQGMVS